MRAFWKVLLVFFVLGGTTLGAGVYWVRGYLKERNRPHYQTAEVGRGNIRLTRDASGTIEPILRVQVGTFVSGPIAGLFVDFNDQVEKDQILAKIDPSLFDAAVKRDKATLATRKADVMRVTAQRDQAINSLNRAKELRKMNEDYVSDAEMDQVECNVRSFEAQLDVAKASILQAEANLSVSQINLGYTDIRSPTAGIVIDRKIDEGQTLTAQFQTPELFVIAPEMDKRMYIYASADEADIGQIREAEKRGERVFFTVDAYPDLFEGKIHEIRLNPTTTQNVVTYPVVVEAPNLEMKLLPGMTASLTFELENREDVLRVPNQALRFLPKREHVREEDQKLLDGESFGSEDENETTIQPSASEMAALRQERDHRHVWVVDGELLRAVEIRTGTRGRKFTELVSGDLTENMELVVDDRPKKP